MFPHRNLKMTLTCWSYRGPDGEGGFLFADPVLHKCRWTDKVELYRDMAGDERTSNAIVYMKDEVREGDYLALGVFDDEGLDPLTIQRAYRVVQCNRITDLRSMQMQYKVYM